MAVSLANATDTVEPSSRAPIYLDYNATTPIGKRIAFLFLWECLLPLSSRCCCGCSSRPRGGGSDDFCDSKSLRKSLQLPCARAARSYHCRDSTRVSLTPIKLPPGRGTCHEILTFLELKDMKSDAFTKVHMVRHAE